MDYMEKVSKRIVSLREEKGETQQELADAIGITRQSLSRYEIAARTINIEVLGVLAQHFGVSADYLLGLSNVRSMEQDMQAACEMTGLSEETIAKLKADTSAAWAVDVLMCSSVSVQDDSFVKEKVSPLNLISQYLLSAFASEDITAELVQLELNKKADISKEEATKIAKNMLDYFTEKELLDRIKLSLKAMKAAIAHSKTINKDSEGELIKEATTEKISVVQKEGSRNVKRNIDLEVKTDAQHHTTEE